MIPADIDTTLPNGLRVVIAAVDGPRVVVEHRVEVGAAHETADARGAAHLVEHLLFPPEGRLESPFARLLAEGGGAANAITRVDETIYTTDVPADRLDALLALEVARFAPHAFAEADVARELGVTAEEHAWRHDTNAVGGPVLLTEILVGHPYGLPVSPSVAGALALDRADAQAFFDRWYRADRITLVIAGPVKPDAVLARVQQLYGPLAGGSPPDPFPALPDWTAPYTVDGPLDHPSLAWRVPGPGNADGDALAWLGGGSDALERVAWKRGALLVVHGAPGVDEDELARAWRARGDRVCATARGRAGAAAPAWSPGAWVAAWGTPTVPESTDACQEAWDRWVRDEAPIRVRAAR